MQYINQTTSMQSAMQTKNKTIMFVAYGPTERSLKEWLPIARKLTKCTSSIYFVIDDNCNNEITNKIFKEGLTAVYYPSGDTSTSNNILKPKKCAAKEKNYIQIPLKRLLSRFLFWKCISNFIFFIKQSNNVNSIISKYNPNTIVLYSDSYNYMTIWTKLAKKNNIKVIIYPLSTPIPANAAGEHRLGSEDFYKYHSLDNPFIKVLSLIFNRHLVDFYGVKFFFYPVHVLLPAAILKILPKLPLSAAGGDAELVLVSSEFAKAIFIDEGVSKDKIAVTGNTWCDYIYTNNSNFCKQSTTKAFLGIKNDLPILLVNVPPYILYDMKSFGISNTVKTSLSDKLFNMLKSLQNCNIVFTLHPGHDSTLPTLIREHGFFYNESLCVEDLLITCDLYVTCPSTTILHSSSLCNPNIILLCFETEYDKSFKLKTYIDAYKKYIDNQANILVCDENKLLGTINELLHDKSKRIKLRQMQKRYCSKWAVLDGQCSVRAAKIIAKSLE